MATAKLNGTELHYEVVGSGPAILMMHGGLGLDHTYFRPEDSAHYPFIEQEDEFFARLRSWLG